ncbi:MAG: M24 family metallopeptidase [Thermosulfidibacteraceae bacterium]|jgi:Xaa-Pro aminopeptidase
MEDLKNLLERYMEFVPHEEIKRRLDKFTDSMNVDIALIGYPPDIYYLAGTKQEGWLIVSKDGKYVFACIKSPNRAKVETPIEVVPIRSLKDIPKVISDMGVKYESAATENDVLGWETVNKIRELLKVDITNISPTIREIKSIKSEWELRIMKRSADIVKAGYEKFKEELREGLTEVELQSLCLLEMRKVGHEAGEYMRGGRFDGFLGYVISGFAGAIPSYANAPLHGIGLSPAIPTGPSFKRIEKGEPIIFDFFGTYMGYLVDMTRTAGLSPLPKEAMEAHRVTIDIHNWLRENLKAGIDAQEIYNGVLSIVEKSRYKEYFMGYGEIKVNFIGHGVGTEINEYPFITKGLSMELKENMVVAIEPKFLLPGIGAVGVENTYIVTKRGGAVLTDAEEDLFIK